MSSSLSKHYMIIHSILLTVRSQSENGSIGLPDFGDSIDVPTFEQILEMDDDEDERDFSKSIVYGFFDQAEVTFRKMDMSLWVYPSNREALVHATHIY